MMTLMTLCPDDSFERAALSRGLLRVAGVDEVGRGPLAGPVTAAAVRLRPGKVPDGLRDSKVLTARRREALFGELMAVAEVSIAHASVEEIDRINILQASHLAMRRAIGGLTEPVEFALVDGNRVPPGLPCPGQAIVKGDAFCLSISAASIVAKVARDRIMVDLAQQHPGYGWERNAGYPTKEHCAALQDLGVTPHHRRSFRPVHNILYQYVNQVPDSNKEIDGESSMTHLYPQPAIRNARDKRGSDDHEDQGSGGSRPAPERDHCR